MVRDATKYPSGIASVYPGGSNRYFPSTLQHGRSGNASIRFTTLNHASSIWSENLLEGLPRSQWTILRTQIEQTCKGW